MSRPDRYEPALNPAYARLAEHYGTAIVPARVRRPRDKPVVEGSVRFVANQVAAVLRDRRFVGLAELNEAIFDEVAEINARPFQKREDSRRIVFVRDEKPLLAPLPPMRFELADLRKAKVGPNYHIQLDRNFYSVPSTLIGRSLDVRVTSHTIEVFDGAERVACHARFTGVRGRYSTVASHMPEPDIATGWPTGARSGSSSGPPPSARTPSRRSRRSWPHEDRRAVLPVLPRRDVAGQEAGWHGPAGGQLRAGAGGDAVAVLHADQEAMGHLATRRSAARRVAGRRRLRARLRLLRQGGGQA